MTAPRSAGGKCSPRRVVLLGLAASALLVNTAPSTALAHDGLVSSTPAPAGAVAGPPDAVELRFTGEPLPLGTEVRVTGPDGAPVSDGPAEIRDTTVVQPLVDALSAGEYRVEWRSTSSDGHPLSGTYDFTVAAGASAPADRTARAAATVQPAEADGADLPAVYPLAGVGLLGTLGLLTARRLRRRR